MKRTIFSIRTLALLTALTMLLLSAGCGKETASSQTTGIPPVSQKPSSSTVGDDDDVEVERVFLIEKIDQGIERNSDTKGWIYIPNTSIDDAVLQYKDNDYYLHLDEDKKYSVFGCYWLDPLSKMGSRDNLSKNSIIYGHSDLKDNPEGKKFSQLFKYTNIDFVRKNPYIFFSTPENDMVWQVFAVFYTHINFNYIQANPSAAEFANIVSEAKARSEYIIDVSVGEDDKILTLSTCTAYYNTADPDSYRLVVMAKLMPSNEVTESTMKVEKNPSPKKS